MKRLKITAAAAVVEERLMDAQVKEPSYQNFLLDLMQYEINRREEKQRLRFYKLASFPEYKTLEDFDLSVQPSLSKKQLNQLKELLWLASPLALLMMFQPVRNY